MIAASLTVATPVGLIRMAVTGPATNRLCRALSTVRVGGNRSLTRQRDLPDAVHRPHSISDTAFATFHEPRTLRRAGGSDRLDVGKMDARASCVQILPVGISARFAASIAVAAYWRLSGERDSRLLCQIRRSAVQSVVASGLHLSGSSNNRLLATFWRFFPSTSTRQRLNRGLPVGPSGHSSLQKKTRSPLGVNRGR